jgi:hypothetical protein
VATALNLGIERSEGEYFSWLSHDDVYCPNKIEVQVDYVRRLERDVIVYSDYETIDEASRTIAVHRLAHFSPAQFRAAFMRYGLISGCTLLVPMACFRASGLFSTDLRTTNDYAKWFELSSRYEFHHLPEVLIRSRVHAEQDTQRLADLVPRECDALYAELIRALSIEDIRTLSVSVPVYYLELANLFWRAGYRASRRRAMWYALRSMSALRRPEDVLRCARLMCVPLISQAKERVRRVLKAGTRTR